MEKLVMSNTSPKKQTTKSTAGRSVKKTPATISKKRPPTAESGEARPKKRRRRPIEVRTRIFEAALEGFARHGFEGTSTRMIAEDAHVSQSLLLYHFQSKDQLWKEVVEYVHSLNTASAILHDEVDVGATSAAGKLRAVIKAYVNMFAKLPSLHRVMAQEAHQSSERLAWTCENYTRKDFDKVCELIIKGQEEGEVREGNPARLRYAIIAMAAVPFSVSAEYQYLANRNPFSRAEIESAIDFINHLVFVDG
ncbi:MAG: TetR/AcrR family transcriptional regulator [Sphingobium sp.]